MFNGSEKKITEKNMWVNTIKIVKESIKMVFRR